MSLLEAEQLYKSGLELFDKNQFGAAQKTFRAYTEGSQTSLIKADAYYYMAACGIELFNRDGEWMMKQFVEKNKSNTKVNNAYFYLAKSNFRKKKYDETIEYLNLVDIYNLDKEQLAELYFKRGYSYLQLNQEEKAKSDFFEIKDVDNKYYAPANYYHAHILYREKNYEQALTGFNRLVGNETFGSVVPYYITQIYFIRGKYPDVVKEAPKLLGDSVGVQKEGEINRMIGESYFYLKQYDKALSYLKKTDLLSNLNAEGAYALAYCYYRQKDYKNALLYFEKVTQSEDSLAQSAWYHQGDCHLKLNEKMKAKIAFYKAFQLGYDAQVNEDALFSFAKLSYELDFSPYNDAVRAFTRFLKEFPNSTHRDACYNYLVNVYSTTKNYSQAIESMESLENINPILKVSYQKLLYFKGVEYFNNNDLDNAEKIFNKSLAQNSDLKWNALNQYWLGEISYIRKDYSTAISHWKKFQLLPQASLLPEYDLSNYAIAYAHFQRKEKDDYTQANLAFRKFLLSKNNYPENKICDATIRAADCYFMNRDFVQAGEYYDKGISCNKLDVDYALYQKALCDGLTKKYNEKIAGLKRLEKNHPNSNYLSAALNQIADTYYRNLNQEEDAILYYERILKNHPNSSFANHCYAQLGNIYYGRKQDDKAFEYYDLFVKADTKSEEARDVLDIIKKILQARGNVEAMEKYFVDIGSPLSENQIEKAAYQTAYEAYYDQKNCDIAILKWQTYMDKFPNGKYATEAHFNYAECAYSKNMLPEALAAYLFVTTRARSVFTEQALAKACFLLNKDKKYTEALPLFLRLQDVAETPANKSAGKFGAMRCAFALNKYDTAYTEANKVLNTEKISPQQSSEARYIKAKSLYELNRLDDALIEFKAIVKSAKNATGAEAYYHMALIYYQKQNYAEVEKTITKLISYEYSTDDWNNAGMLLMAKAYLANEETADAQVLLQTLIENKPKEPTLSEANTLLEQINFKDNERKLKENQIEGGEMKVQFKENESDKNIFNKTEPEKPVEPQTENPKNE
ncbi:MAG: tetratricopeptide repeat protein [Bacteroidia bacterium]|nr:tetratricopeptide repeat protein [Bacteroidia bacterium]